MSIKRIIPYINGALGYGLWYPYDFSLVIDGYSDVECSGNVKDRKNTSFIGDCLVAWLSKKQNSISLSIVEAKYIAVKSCCMQLLWISKCLKTMELNMHYDNSSAINISKNPVLHSRTNHIEVHHHFIKDLIEEKVVSLKFILFEL